MFKEALEFLFARERAAAEIKEAPGGEHFIVTPQGAIQSLAPMMPPSRIRGNIALIDAGSFCDYVNRFKSPDTLIFASVTDKGAKLTAILDFHQAPARPVIDPVQDTPSRVPAATIATPGTPAYCNHRATLELIETEDWKQWNAAEGANNSMSQEEFAEWLEEHEHLFNVKDLDTPLKGADLLQMVCTLQAKNNVRYNRAIRLADGKNSFDYEEDTSVQGASAGGMIQFPSMIKAALQPFEGGPTYPVDVRLKVRINQRALVIWFETCQKHKIVRDAVLGTVKLVTEKTGIIPLIGTAQ